jgi:transposase-like protein
MATSDVTQPKRNKPPRRPTTYRSSYCAAVVDSGEQGYSLTAFAASVNVTKMALWKWRQQHPDFDEACEIAKAKCTRWWEEKARAAGDGGDAARAFGMVKFMLMNYAPEDFKEKHEVEHTYNEDFAARLIRARERRIAEELAAPIIIDHGAAD